MWSMIDFNALISKAAKEQCEISVVTKPNGETEINVHPWKPSRYRTTTEVVEDQPKEDA